MESEILSGLNEKQKMALLQTEGAVLVTAGAGSGKTKLLTHRISYLIKEMGVNPYNILALTFTNKAAKEMKERCENLVEGGDKIWISTFHSMCARILRYDIDKLSSYDKNFTIYSDQDSDKVFKKIFDNFGIEKDDIKKLITFHISNLKNNNMSIFEYEKVYSYLNNFILIKKVYLEYQKELNQANALDFNDLLNKTYELFITCPEVLQGYQSRFKYILVDEFQDTNKIQYDLIKLLSGKYKNIFVVGDEDQCIYTWRGANFANIFDFQKDFDNAKLFKLERNYRSTKNILDLANKLIKNNKSRMEKNLWTENNGGIEPDVRLVYDEREEAEIVAREIYDLVNNQGYNYGDFAVLVRLNALTYHFEQKFLSYNINHTIFGGFKFYERVEIKNIISYLRIFINPRDEVSLLRIINFPKRGIGDSAISAIKEIAEKNGLSLLDTILKIEELGAPNAIINKLSEFKRKYIKLMSEYELQSLYDFVVSVINEYDIKGAYNTNSEENIDKCLNIDTFISSVKDFTEKNTKTTLTDFLESVTLTTDIDTMDNSKNCVTIATVHAVKGLEFKYVFIVGLEENIFPISRAREKDDDMEEERRLMYVAITRARERLMLSRCKTRYMYNKKDFAIDSRFLKELGFTKQEEISPSLTKKYDQTYSHSHARGFNYNANVEFNEVTNQKSQYAYNPMNMVKPKAEEKEPTMYEKYMQEQNDKKSDNSYEEGQSVLHPKFGIGKIVKISGKFIDIEFDKLGVKTLLLDIAPLKIIK
ncbi:MAG: 3'-5' exonuclease [Clostridia bacterium]|nr:3'-5' exonuclease [Clostridia bacterium]